METVEYPDEYSARRALLGSQQTAANRFFRGATGKSRGFKTTAVGGDQYQLEFFSPGRTAGYGKRYVQVIGPEGEVIREFKETLGPQGLIETKWVHNGPEAHDDQNAPASPA